MVCKGTSHKLLGTSFQKVSFGIHRALVASGDTGSDGYGVISARDIMASLCAV